MMLSIKLPGSLAIHPILNEGMQERRRKKGKKSIPEYSNKQLSNKRSSR